MKYLKEIYEYKRKLPKLSLGGFPVVGAINPQTGQPYTTQEIQNYTKVNPFDSEYGTVNSLDGLEPNKVKSLADNYVDNESLVGMSKKPLTGNPKPSYWNRINPETKKDSALALGSVAANYGAKFIDDASTSSVDDAFGVSYQKKDVAGGVASGAAKGAAISASLGFADFGASAVIGGVIGGIQSKLDNDKTESAILDSNRRMSDYRGAKAKNRYANLKSQGFNTQGNETTMFADGGKIKKPLVNWFSREKEISYSNVLDSKGNVILNKVTKKPLQRKVKTVTAPDSVLSRGFKKEVVTEDKNKVVPMKNKNINLVLPALAPTALGYLGATQLKNAFENQNGGNELNFGQQLVGVSSLVAGAAGTAAMIKDANDRNAYLIDPDKSVGNSFLEFITGIPVKYKVGKYHKDPKNKSITEKSVTKNKNYTTPEQTILSPRFMAEGGEIPRKPIFVSDPNDKRLLFYQDSLDVYNRSELEKNRLLKNKNHAFVIIGDKNNSKIKTSYKTTYNKVPKNFNKNLDPNTRDENPYNDHMKPVSMLTKSTTTKTKNGERTNNGFSFSELTKNENVLIYKKPVQPYVYKKFEPKPKQDYWNTDKDVLAFRKKFVEKFGEEPIRDPNIAKYDYDKAYKAGVRPVLDSTDGLYHWDSEFKHDDHPNLIVNGVNTKTGKPVEQPKKVEQPVKPTYTSKKQLFQGSDFTLQTGLKPGLYHPEEIEEVKKQKKGQPVSKIIPKYAKGGSLTPQYEVEKNEVVQGQDTQLEEGTELASDMTLVGGNTHENGGTKGSGGDRVFSDRLKASKMLSLILEASGVKLQTNATYAKAAEIIGNKKSKFEEGVKSPDPIKNKTSKVMLERLNGVLDLVFQEQESLKEQENTEIMAHGGKIPKYGKGIDMSGYVTPEQGINTAVYLANLKNANKQKTNIKRVTGEPTYLEKMNYLPYAKNAIEKAVRVGYLNNRRSSGNVQDRFGRDAILTATAMDKTNEAVQNQFERDYAVNSANAQIKSGYDSRIAENLNADMLDKVTGENAILTNKQTATNAWLSGVMANIASKRQYDVDNTKLAIARMDGNRGTAYRSAAKLLKDPSIKGTELEKSLESFYGTREEFAKGGSIKKFKKMKSYC